MIMIKKGMALLLSLAMIASMAACGQKAAETTAAKTAETQTQAETAKAPETTAAPATAAPTAAPATAAAATTAAPETTAAAPVQAGEQEPVTILHPIVKDYYECAQRADNTFVYEAEASFLALNDEEAAAYPNLDNALTEDYNEYVYVHVADFVDRFMENTKDMNLQLDGTKPYQQTTRVIRMDDRMASILFVGYEFLGGAHGYTVLQSFNYEIDKMAWVNLSGIVKDNDKLQKILVEKLKSEYPENQYFDLEKDIKNYTLDNPAKDGKISYIWTMDYDSLQIYFPEEALGPHANGSQEIDLKFADYPDLLVNNYGAAPADYIRKVEPYVNISMGDKTVRADYRVDEHGTYTKLVFSVDGKETTFDTFSYKAETWYVTRNGHSFFYVFTKGDDDEQIFTVYAIDGTNVTELQKMNGCITRTYEKTEALGAPEGYTPYASQQVYELPADPAAVKVTVGDHGSQKDMVVSVAEDGTVSLK